MKPEDRGQPLSTPWSVMTFDYKFLYLNISLMDEVCPKHSQTENKKASCYNVLSLSLIHI